MLPVSGRDGKRFSIELSWMVEQIAGTKPLNTHLHPRDLPRVLPCSWEPSSLAITELRLTSKRSPKRRVQNQPNPHTLTHEEFTNNVNDVLIRMRSGIQHADAKRATTSVALSSAILIDSNFLVW
jgi:hypothetical protein